MAAVAEKRESTSRFVEDKDAAQWHPFPWFLVPDPVWAAIGVLEMLFIGAPMAILIVTANCSWFLMKAVYDAVPLLQRLPDLVRAFSIPAGKALLRDPRDHSYIPWILFLSTWPVYWLYWAYTRHTTYGFEISTFLVYHFLRIGPRFRFFAHLHVLVHKEGHDHLGMWKGPLKVLNWWWVQWIPGSIYGQVPNSYGVSHNKIHHRWHNDVDDVHTNLDLDRTDFYSFLVYVPRFTLYWMGVTPVLMFCKRGEYTLALKQFYGMAFFYGLVALAWSWDWSFSLFYLLFPNCEANLFLAGISYMWHAWVDPDDPTNQYINSVTILDGRDNIWNEDYHVVHHHSPITHWTEMPAHFESHKHLYQKYQATIFRDTEEGEMLYWMFAKKWDTMAEHFVDLSGKMTHQEKKDLIVRRLGVRVGEGGRKQFHQDLSSWGATEIRDWDKAK
eukprot:m.287215 g.287215  ORF g.287215 m.287215 type:complete len:443 (-) comp11730_c0_seq1:335-1663(-)